MDFWAAGSAYHRAPGACPPPTSMDVALDTWRRIVEPPPRRPWRGAQRVGAVAELVG
jgi:hypothetical protein